MDISEDMQDAIRRTLEALIETQGVETCQNVMTNMLAQNELPAHVSGLDAGSRYRLSQLMDEYYKEMSLIFGDKPTDDIYISVMQKLSSVVCVNRKPTRGEWAGIIMNNIRLYGTDPRASVVGIYRALRGLD